MGPLKTGKAAHSTSESRQLQKREQSGQELKVIVFVFPIPLLRLISGPGPVCQKPAEVW